MSQVQSVKYVPVWPQVPGFTYVFLSAESIRGKLDGVPGFEPGNDGIKIRCLTA